MKKTLLLYLLAINSILFAHEWNPYEIDTDKNLNDVFFLTENLGWIVGDDGVIFKFENEEWVQIEHNITSETLTSAYFINDSTGWIVGNNGIILKYSNDVITLVESPTNADLRDIFFVGENFGWIVGGTKTILELNGESWQAYNTDQFILENYKHIQFSDTTFGAIVGNWVKGFLTYTDGEWAEHTDGINLSYYNGLYVKDNENILTTVNKNEGGNYGGYLEIHVPTMNIKSVSDNINFGSSTCDIDIAENIGWSIFNSYLFLYEEERFKRYDENISYQGIKAISVVNDSTGWMVGNNGDIRKWKPGNTGYEIDRVNTPFAQDDGSTNTSEDIKASFLSNIDVSYISDFRAFVIPFSNTSSVDATYAWTLPDNHYTSISSNLSDTVEFYLNKNQLDYYGNPLTDNITYRLRILSVPDSINSFVPKFSEPSTVFSLETNVSFYAGQKEGNGVHWFEWDSTFSPSKYIAFVGQGTQYYELDLNNDGVMDVAADVYNYFNAGHGLVWYYKFSGLNENKVITSFRINDWLVLLNEEDPISDIYNWHTGDGVLDQDYFTNDAGFYNSYYENNYYYLGFSIIKGGDTQYAWLKLKGTEYMEYGYFENNTGSNENKYNNQFRLYPNPASNSIKIQSFHNIDFSQNTYITVYNMIGIQVDEFEINNLVEEKELSHYSKGIYLFEIKQNDQSLETHKILVE